MSDPRHAINTADVLALIRAVNVSLGKAKSKKVRIRLTILREKLVRIRQFDAVAINTLETR